MEPAPTDSYDWRKDVLRSWVLHHDRGIDEKEMLSLLVLLRISRNEIEVLVEQIRAENACSVYTQVPTTNTSSIYNGAEFHSSQETHEFGSTSLRFNDSGAHGDTALSVQNTDLILPGDQLLDHVDITSNNHHFNDIAVALESSPTITSRSATLAENPCTSANPKEGITNAAHTKRYPTTNALRQLALNVMKSSNSRACKPNKHERKQEGPYVCDVGCDYQCKRIADKFRHEQGVYPQRFFFCFLCGNSHRPSEKHLFTRKDKFAHHLREQHKGSINTHQCELTGIKTAFPEKCELCMTYRHTSWESRQAHIRLHYKKGHVFRSRSARDDSSKSDDLAEGQSQNHDDDDDNDDDQDEDGSEDDSDDNPDDNDEDANGRPGEPSREHGPDGSEPNLDHDNHSVLPDDTDESFDMSQYMNFDFLGFPASINLRFIDPLSDLRANFGFSLTIKWLERVNKKGGTASVFKVMLPVDLDKFGCKRPKIYAVKQYPAHHQNIYEREVEVFKSLINYKIGFRGIAKCYGTFEYTNKMGKATRNLLLEYGECDLREYWADNKIPQLPSDVLAFWKSLKNIANALDRLHGIKDSFGQQYHIVHGDIKPDNIIRVDNTFKLVDFGFAKISILNKKTTSTSIKRGKIEYYISLIVGSVAE